MDSTDILERARAIYEANEALLRAAEALVNDAALLPTTGDVQIPYGRWIDLRKALHARKVADRGAALP